ncbi:MAG: AAA family ATPase [Ignavibacteriae bacterium]|nr:AAA family ATPase [Ignavibacteriota bacterium]
MIEIPKITDIENIIAHTIYLKNDKGYIDYKSWYERGEINLDTYTKFVNLRLEYEQYHNAIRKPFTQEPPFQVKTVRELLTEADKSTPFLWGDVIPKGEFVGIVGKSGVNKSTFCRQLCLSVAGLKPMFCGFPLTPFHKRTLYCYSEEGEVWIRRYLRKNCKGLGFQQEFLNNMSVMNMEDFDDGDSMLEAIRDAMIERPFDLIVMDSYSDFISKFGAKLNDNDTIRSLKTEISFLKNDGCSVIFNHHTSDKASTIGTFLGATAFKQIIRSQIEIIEDGNKRILSCEKNSYGAKFEPIVCTISEDFLFETTGESMTREELAELVANKNNIQVKPACRPKIAPCDYVTVASVFGNFDTLRSFEIIKRLMERFVLSERSANAWINDVVEYGLIEKVQRGEYRKLELKSNSVDMAYVDDALFPGNLPSFDVWEDTPEFPTYPGSEFL